MAATRAATLQHLHIARQAYSWFGYVFGFDLFLPPTGGGGVEEDAEAVGIPILVTASSADGRLKLWRLDPRPDKQVIISVSRIIF